MKLKEAFISGLLIFSMLLYGNTKYAYIDSRSKEVPFHITGYKEIANHLTKGLNTDVEKARALYIWITHNIEYDLGLVYANKTYSSTTEIIDEVMQKKQGVCQHYSDLFHAMAVSVGLKSYVILGYAKDAYGFFNDLGHAWNAVQLDSKFYLMDLTWAAGYTYQNKWVKKFRDEFFLIPPEEFIKHHMPLDPIWQFLDNPLNHHEFISGDFSRLEERGSFSYKDTIAAYEKMDTLKRLETSTSRIINAGIENHIIESYVNYSIMKISKLKINIAIKDMNFGISKFNTYITHRNGRFKNPPLKRDQVLAILSEAENNLIQADKILYSMDTDNREIKRYVKQTRSNILKILSNIQKERDFVNQFL